MNSVRRSLSVLWLSPLLYHNDIFATALSFQPNHVLSGLLGGLEGPGYNFLPQQPLQPRAQELLERLGIEASLEPVLAKVAPSQLVNIVSASVPAVLRASGVFGLDYQLQWIPRDDAKYAYIATKTSQLEETCFAKPPAQPIILYDVESSPNCRRVREACSILSLTVDVRPVPRGGRMFGLELKQYGASDAPCIFDPNTAVSVSGAKRIIDFLFTTYGNGEVPSILGESEGDERLLSWQSVSSALAVGLFRLNAGGSYIYSKTPPRTADGKPTLTLWAYEGSPFCKMVAEALSSLELEHTVVYAPRGSLNRALLWQKVGRFQVPYLEDTSTGVSLFESTTIVEYLQKQYKIAPSPIEFM